MEIDFHHAVIYVLSRIAGFDKNESEIISASSQFVDDAIWDKPISFLTGEIYNPISSAHKILDYRNFNDLANRISWVSFHFLPGNCNLTINNQNTYSFEERLICLPNNSIAKDMINECILRKNDINSLYRLGITLHVYADTWSHMGFSGIQSQFNKVSYLNDDIIGEKLKNKIKSFFTDIFNITLGEFIDNILPLGHGAVLGYPDKPYLKWKYIDYKKNVIHRNNTELFMEATQNIYKVLQRYKGVQNNHIVELDIAQANKIRKLFENIITSNHLEREAIWLNYIENNYFGFGSEKIKYEISGDESWEYKAFDGNMLNINQKYQFNSVFLNSHWKNFHDALIDHNFYLTHILFPKYNLYVS